MDADSKYVCLLTIRFFFVCSVMRLSTNELHSSCLLQMASPDDWPFPSYSKADPGLDPLACVAVEAILCGSFEEKKIELSDL